MTHEQVTFSLDCPSKFGDKGSSQEFSGLRRQPRGNVGLANRSLWFGGMSGGRGYDRNRREAQQAHDAPMAAAVTWCLAFGAYLLFAGQVDSMHELMVGAVLASGAAVWAWLIRRCSGRRFALSRQHAVVWLKAIIRLFPASAKVFGMLLKAAARGGSPGRAVTWPFLWGGEDDPTQRTRRASVVLAASLAPDSFVVRAEPQQEQALIHTLLRPRPRDRRWLT